MIKEDLLKIIIGVTAKELRKVTYFTVFERYDPGMFSDPAHKVKTDIEKRAIFTEAVIHATYSQLKETIVKEKGWSDFKFQYSMSWEKDE